MHLRVSTSTFAHVRLRVYICGHVCMLPCLRMCCVHIRTCAYPHMCMCLSVYLCAHVWLCMFTCMDMCACLHVGTCVCCVSARLCVCFCVHVCVCGHACLYVRACVHACASARVIIHVYCVVCVVCFFMCVSMHTCTRVPQLHTSPHTPTAQRLAPRSGVTVSSLVLGPGLGTVLGEAAGQHPALPSRGERGGGVPASRTLESGGAGSEQPVPAHALLHLRSIALHPGRGRFALCTAVHFRAAGIRLGSICWL